VLKEPYGQVLATLAKPNNPALIMRKREATTDPATQVTEAVGSGPFRFAREQWVPGNRTVYLRNAAYVPRKEPARAMAGGKVAGVDRIELIWMPDPQTAMQALVNGEIDLLEQPAVDFIPILERSRGVSLMKTGRIDSLFGMIRLNHLHPPFDNVKVRQAMYKLINQEDFLRTVVGNPQYYKVCHGLMTCGSPLENRGGSAMLAGYDPKGAAAAFRAAGYRGEPITILHATDHHTINPITQVMIQAMREAGLNLDVQAMDWGSVVQRRARREPPAQGGWNIFVTTSSGISGTNPIIHTWLGAACDRGLAGWPCDEEIERLRNRWGFAQTDAERLSIATELQTRAIENVVYVPTGQWTQPLAFRSDRLSGIVPVTPHTVFWNIAKR
jgi:peptide/nickel transport system substrate-binding protein